MLKLVNALEMFVQKSLFYESTIVVEQESTGQSPK